jgi:hypothetical protein
MAALTIGTVGVSGCQPADDAKLIYDVSGEKYYVAQWGDWRKFVNCPEGTIEATVASIKPRRRDTRVAKHFARPISISTKTFEFGKYNRSKFYECKEPRKDA